MFKITWSCGISIVRFERVGDRSFFKPVQYFFFFFLHGLCPYTTLWVMIDLSVSTYNNLVRLGTSYLFISALSRRAV